jgi:hypothetical protein
MSITSFILLLLAAVVVVYVALATRTYLRMRGTRVVECPETRQPAAVTVDAGHAAVSSFWDKPDIQLKTCSRWPERHDCNQACVRQIAEQPQLTLAANMLKNWYVGRTCAICRRAIGTLHPAEPRPGLLDATSPTREILSWDDIPAEQLPSALETHVPVCPNCVVAETFRRQYPQLVTDREDTPQRDRIYH